MDLFTEPAGLVMNGIMGPVQWEIKREGISSPSGDIWNVLTSWTSFESCLTY